MLCGYASLLLAERAIDSGVEEAPYWQMRPSYNPCDCYAQRNFFNTTDWGSVNVPELTIFYDGGCPLCMKEILPP